MVHDQVDVIVNTVSPAVDLQQGAVASSILQVAGQEIQNECAMKSPSGANYGEVIVTRGYKLCCQNVYHAVCQKWDDSKKDETVLS